jgi:hypothetical protein
MAVMAGFALTDLERQLLRLALCSSAQGGEITTSAQKLIQSLRNRGVESVSIETALDGDQNGAEPAIRMSRPDWGLVTCPLRKYKGQMLMDIPPSYLRWALRWTNDVPDRAAYFKDFADAINRFLNQEQ